MCNLCSDKIQRKSNQRQTKVFIVILDFEQVPLDILSYFVNKKKEKR